MANHSWRQPSSPPSRPRRKTSERRRRLSWLALLAGLVLSGSAAASLPDFTAHYRVTLGAFTVGEASIAYERLANDRYRYRSLTRSTGIPGLLYRREVSESSEGSITADGFRPDRYSYDRRGRGSRQAELLFDWERNRVVNTVDRQRWQMTIPTDTLDRLVSKLQLMQDLARPAPQLHYHIADGGHLRTYQLRIEGRETLRTRVGELETLRVSRLQEGGDQRTTFWAAPALNYLPVRLDHRDGNDAYRMTLDRVEGLPGS